MYCIVCIDCIGFSLEKAMLLLLLSPSEFVVVVVVVVVNYPPSLTSVAKGSEMV